MKSISKFPPSPSSQTMLEELHSLRDWRRVLITRLALGEQADSSTSHSQPLTYGHGGQDAEAESLQVLSWVTRMHPMELDKHLDARLCTSEKSLIIKALEQRLSTRQPMAYILGEAWFGDLRLKADARALVPRSLILEALSGSLWETVEEREHNYFERIKGAFAGQTLRILDLCTGGGSIAIRVALDFPSAQIYASDLCGDALSLARENVEIFGLGEQICLHQGDLFSGLPQQFDLVLCNPPYVNAASMAALPAEFLVEPKRALAGGEDGMDLIRRIFAAAPEHMAEDALMVLEIGHEADHFEAAFPWLNYSYIPVTGGQNMLVLVSRSDLVAMAQTESG